MKIEELKKDLESEDLEYVGFCHDCGVDVNVNASIKNGGIEIEGGAVYKITQGIEEKVFLKCDTCYAIDKTLTDFQPCEVFSRVVGYLRPVNQWNKGKKEEFKMRKEFTNTRGL
jgi:hypothetical protein